MTDIKINKESYPERCEICHQSDAFDAYQNYCSRCHANNIVTSQQYLASMVIDKQGTIFLKNCQELTIIDSSKFIDSFGLQKIIILSLGTILCINKSIMTQNYIFFLISAFVSLILLKTLIYKYRSTLRSKAKSGKVHTSLKLTEIKDMQLDCTASKVLKIHLKNDTTIKLISRNGDDQLITDIFTKISAERENALAANNGLSHQLQPDIQAMRSSE